MRISAENMVDVLRAQARDLPDHVAFTWLRDGESDEVHTTFAEIDRRARQIAVHLAQHVERGDRAVLLYPSDMEYVAAFYGTLYGGLIAVTAYPPDPARLARTLPRLRAIIGDADAKIILTTRMFFELREALFMHAPELRDKIWVATDALSDDPNGWQRPDVDADTIAFLQYTSGSTAMPKGVMVTHGNLLAFARGCEAHDIVRAGAVNVGWMPLFHDFGLMAQVIVGVCVAARSVFMSPQQFLEKPFRWLAALSRYRGVATAGPNFAYELAARRTTPEDRAKLDLASLRMAFNGAEPVRVETLEKFDEVFGPHGLAPTVQSPGYGLAEATLVVSSGRTDIPAPIGAFDVAALESGRVVPVARDAPGARLLPSAGVPWDDVAIVDPEKRTRCAPDVIGEIWARGGYIAKGYWRRPEETMRTFHATIEGEGGQRWLRTGDLGFMLDGELYIAGRQKDLVIVRGRNHYPQDIELTVEHCNPAVRRGCVIAFPVTAQGDEQLVIAAEIDVQKAKQPFDADVLAEEIRAAIAQNHEITPHAVVFLEPRTISKTSSGKLQRRAQRAAFIENTATEIARVVFGDAGPSSSETSFDSQRFESGDLEERTAVVELYLRGLVGRAAGLPLQRVDPTTAIGRFGLDSLKVVELANDLEGRTGFVVEPSSFLKDVPLRELARDIAELEGPRSTASSLLPRDKKGEPRVPTSFGQEVFLRWQESNPTSCAWNMTGAVAISGPLDAGHLRAAASDVAARHETLRTYFELLHGRSYQKTVPPSEVILDIDDLRSLPPSAVMDQVTALARADATKPFDVFAANGPTPLVRFRLCRTAETEHVLILTLHHLAMDWDSIAIFADELVSSYSLRAGGRSPSLPSLSLEYGDYAIWERGVLDTTDVSRAKQFWRTKLAGAQPVVFKPCGSPLTGASAAYRAILTVPEETAAALNALAQSEAATPTMLLLTVYYACLRKWSGQRDIVVPMLTSSRRRTAEMGAMIGHFTDFLPMRLSLDDGLTVRQALRKVRDFVVTAYEHKLPSILAFDDPSPLETPWLNIRLNVRPSTWMGKVARVAGGAEVNFRPIPMEPSIHRRADCALQVSVIPAGLFCVLALSAQLFDQASARGMVAEFAATLKAFVAEPDRPFTVV